MSGQSTNQPSHKFAITINVTRKIDPERVEEYCRANFKDESVVMQDLDGEAAYQFQDGEFDEV